MESTIKSHLVKQFRLASDGQAGGCAARTADVSGLVKAADLSASLRRRGPFSVQRVLLKYGLMTRRKPVREG